MKIEPTMKMNFLRTRSNGKLYIDVQQLIHFVYKMDKMHKDKQILVNTLIEELEKSLKDDSYCGAV